MTQPVAGFHGNATCSIRVKCLEAQGLEVHVGGELDAHTAATLDLVLDDCLAERRPIALDLSSVTFIDRPALAVVTRACRRAPAPITIVATSAAVDRLLALSEDRYGEPPSPRLVG